MYQRARESFLTQFITAFQDLSLSISGALKLEKSKKLEMLRKARKYSSHISCIKNIASMSKKMEKNQYSESDPSLYSPMHSSSLSSSYVSSIGILLSQLLQEHISVQLRSLETHKQVSLHFRLHLLYMSSSTWEVKSKLKVDQFYYNYYFTNKSKYFNNLYCSYHHVRFASRLVQSYHFRNNCFLQITLK